MKLLDSNFNGIQHIGIPVTDIQRSKAFYQRLGFEDVMSDTFTHNDETGHASMMKRDRTILEIYQMPDKELQEIRKRTDGRIDHIAFDVEDIDRAFDELKKEGYEILEDQPAFIDFWKSGCKYFNILGPDGERLEFCQIL